ncbi:MAG: GNAT family N-acetyltransferase, partial [Flavobacteriales bacterium]|nr:GNAT family N-acetyltransferase [Flavobacteriales bacterium]
MKVSLRKATKNDLPDVLRLIKELAEFEKALPEVTITLKELEEDGFGEHPLYWIILAESEEGVIGMSFYYIRYSTWTGRNLFLEDIIVKEAFRGNNVGKLLFEETIKEARKMKVRQ